MEPAVPACARCPLTGLPESWMTRSCSRAERFDGCAPMTVRILIRWPERQLEGLLRDTPSTGRLLDSMPVAQAAVVSGEDFDSHSPATRVSMRPPPRRSTRNDLLLGRRRGVGAAIRASADIAGYECCLATAVNISRPDRGRLPSVLLVCVRGDP